ncbi:MAG: ImmA/IrrE family metallo-endopeptidase [Cytophagaceae bacterium]|jgi:Zn-dependent peptidase ImmA (M78 family)|nr:ImmA/IrrE family metallo-endopeptidase [Cytophagaceae bacterium]
MSKSKFIQFELEKKASAFRNRFGYNDQEPIHLSSLLLKCEVLTLFMPLSEKFSGMAVKAGDARFMMINENHSLGRQHFSIAHELYHLFVQENFLSQKCLTGMFDKQTDPEERKADLFAALLLMPESGIMQLIPDKELSRRNQITTETIFKLQHFFSVSLKSLLYRLVELELIDTSYFARYENVVKNTARRLGYDVALYEKGNAGKIIGDYGSLANQLLQRQVISESYFLELMNAIGVDPFADLVDSYE